MHVLIIENKQDMTFGLSNFLESKGHVVDSVGSVFFSRHPALVVEYDAIILDVILRETEGMELCRKLRAGGCATMPLMMISARDSLDGKFVCMEVDAEEYSVRLATMNEIESRLRVLFRMNTRLKMNAN